MADPTPAAPESAAPQDEQEWARLAEECQSEAPWEAWRDEDGSWHVRSRPRADDDYTYGVADIPQAEKGRTATIDAIDAKFIAAARTAVPVLLARLAEARREAAEWQRVAEDRAACLTQAEARVDAALARAEQAEREAEHYRGAGELLIGAEEMRQAAEDSLAALRSRVAALAGRLDAMRGEAERGFIFGHARTTPDWTEAVNRYERSIAALRSLLGEEGR